MDYYIQDQMIKAAEQYLLRNNIEYIAPAENVNRGYEPSLVVTPCSWGQERAVIAIDAYADDKDRPVLEIAGYIPASVTSDWNETMLLAVVNQENINSDGLIFAMEETESGRHVTVRSVLNIDNDEFPEQRFDEAFTQIREIIKDYRSAARERGHFPPSDPKNSVNMPDMPE